ncbi:MAG: tRNA pseudouridine(13) synthase TruD, partial [Campylobacterales bacterium]
MKRLSLLTHSPIEFYFNQNPKDFVVTEVPLYEFSGEGEHLVLKVAKRGLSTHELLNTLSSSAHIPIKEIGYAGLKDKQAYTIQHISLPKKYEKNLEYLSDENIKILERTLHKNKLKTGHLKGNHFFIRIKKLNPTDATKITSVIDSIRKYGFANYFGYQRFGRDGDNAKEGKIVAQNQRGRVNYKKE